MYAEATLCAGWDSKAKAIDTSGITSDPRSEIDEVYHSLRYGCQRFLEQAGIGKMTIGLSGGIDSAVTARPVCRYPRSRQRSAGQYAQSLQLAHDTDDRRTNSAGTGGQLYRYPYHRKLPAYQRTAYTDTYPQLSSAPRFSNLQSRR